ncbi:MAG: hypothetical protein FJ135_16320 [Deltaproteobacteria bacterium]|nr:hypothetical protein [Deltaproteobacteria bacterium]
MKNLVLPTPQVILLFNALSDLDFASNLRLQVPLLRDLTLGHCQAGATGMRLDNLVTAKTYEARHHQVARVLREGLREEIPDYRRLRDSFYQCGALLPQGCETLAALIQEAGRRPLTQGGDVYYLALDTNLLRDRFYSTYLRQLRRRPGIDFVLCNTVREELKNRRGKFSRKALQEFDALNFPLFRGLFSNQNHLEDRLRYLGFLEYNRLREETGCVELDSPPPSLGGSADRLIRDAYSDFVEAGRKVVFLSRDQEIIRLMAGEDNVIPLALAQTEDLPDALEMSWDHFLAWLYIMGLTYGRIILAVGNLPVAALDGVWSRKKAHEWEDSMLRLELLLPATGEQADPEAAFLARSIQRHVEVLPVLAQITGTNWAL